MRAPELETDPTLALDAVAAADEAAKQAAAASDAKARLRRRVGEAGSADYWGAGRAASED